MTRRLSLTGIKNATITYYNIVSKKSSNIDTKSLIFKVELKIIATRLILLPTVAIFHRIVCVPVKCSIFTGSCSKVYVVISKGIYLVKIGLIVLLFLVRWLLSILSGKIWETSKWIDDCSNYWNKRTCWNSLYSTMIPSTSYEMKTKAKHAKAVFLTKCFITPVWARLVSDKWKLRRKINHRLLFMSYLRTLYRCG